MNFFKKKISNNFLLEDFNDCVETKQQSIENVVSVFYCKPKTNISSFLNAYPGIEFSRIRLPAGKFSFGNELDNNSMIIHKTGNMLFAGTQSIEHAKAIRSDCLGFLYNTNEYINVYDNETHKFIGSKRITMGDDICKNSHTINNIVAMVSYNKKYIKRTQIFVDNQPYFKFNAPTFPGVIGHIQFLLMTFLLFGKNWLLLGMNDKKGSKEINETIEDIIFTTYFRSVFLDMIRSSINRANDKILKNKYKLFDSFMPVFTDDQLNMWKIYLKHKGMSYEEIKLLTEKKHTKKKLHSKFKKNKKTINKRFNEDSYENIKECMCGIENDEVDKDDDKTIRFEKNVSEYFEDRSYEQKHINEMSLPTSLIFDNFVEFVPNFDYTFFFDRTRNVSELLNSV